MAVQMTKKSNRSMPLILWATKCSDFGLNHLFFHSFIKSIQILVTRITDRQSVSKMMIQKVSISQS